MVDFMDTVNSWKKLNCDNDLEQGYKSRWQLRTREFNCVRQQHSPLGAEVTLRISNQDAIFPDFGKWDRKINLVPCFTKDNIIKTLAPRIQCYLKFRQWKNGDPPKAKACRDIDFLSVTSRKCFLKIITGLRQCKKFSVFKPEPGANYQSSI